MSKKLVGALLVATATIMLTAPAHAGDGFIGVGAKFGWDNYKTAIVDYTTADAAPVYTSLDFASPRFGGEFQWGITRQIVLTADLDFAFFKHKMYPYLGFDADSTDGDAPDVNEDYDNETEHQFFKFGFGIGAKFFFKRPEAGIAAPYLSVGVGKYFAKASSTDNTEKLPADATNAEALAAWEQDRLFDQQLEVISKLASPFYAELAFGAEFFATDAFSIGADILGLRLETAKADVGMAIETPSAVVASPSFSGEQSYLNFYVYSALTLNFNLTAKKPSPGAAQSGAGWSAPQKQDTGWGSQQSGGWSDGSSQSQATPAPQPQPQPAPQPEPQPEPQPREDSWDTPPPPPAP